MSQFTGLLGIGVIFLSVYMMSNNRQAINWRLVFCGVSLQLFLAMFILRTSWGQNLFQVLGNMVEKILSFAEAGAGFVFGPLVSQPEKLIEIFGPGGSFIFVFKLVPVFIFVASLAALAYHFGIMQKIVGAMAWVIYRLMGASGAEATSNSASIFVGQVEAQILIKPFLASATRSELLAIMSGSMACISGGIMAVYINMGIAANYLMTASVMAIPGALVISKILLPEVEESLTQGTIKLEIKKESVNAIDAIVNGAGDGLKIGLVVTAMLIAFISLITMLDFLLGNFGSYLASSFYETGESALILNMDLNNLTLSSVLGAMFYYLAILMGVPVEDALQVGGLMGTKLVINEFVAYSQMVPMISSDELSPKAIVIATFALCGFASFGSVAMLIGGISEMIPERKHELATLAIPAMICGTLVSYLSATLAGLLYLPPESSLNNSMILPLTVMTGSVAVIAWFNYRILNK
ncbi:MAG: NupC/NupG family nucleoside CNT transporter [Gammaproteobacteria bacterium]|nr:NupC/NupG family nucleoside CNT transporter [Gammaproteobacteria bacterium]